MSGKTLRWPHLYYFWLLQTTSQFLYHGAENSAAMSPHLSPGQIQPIFDMQSVAACQARKPVKLLRAGSRRLKSISPKLLKVFKSLETPNID
ncbi:hypothetical protein M747DRAFT_159448 [Aspergillus niger ATCC 13496]|uniref:Uncharacterized protein n=1 Tax=Aspergillus niger ATCC 13496 TaxID=1353008 RepID=A0A370BNB6_ASPNG|nr:hypothetical protein M747DRAFT_159448 [Aspergillus niger ATCC 13496]